MPLTSSLMCCTNILELGASEVQELLMGRIDLYLKIEVQNREPPNHLLASLAGVHYNVADRTRCSKQNVAQKRTRL